MSISFQNAVRRALPQPIWHWSHLHCGITRRYLMYMALRLHVYGCNIWFDVLSKLRLGCMLLWFHKWHMRVCVHAMLMRDWDFIALQIGCPCFWDMKRRWVICWGCFGPSYCYLFHGSKCLRRMLEAGGCTNIKGYPNLLQNVCIFSSRHNNFNSKQT